MQQQEVMWLLKEKYHGEKTAGFFTDCDRLKAGEPLAYIIGSIPFLDCTIYLDSKPLIPRPETEYWVEKAISSIKKTLSEVVVKHPQRESSQSSRRDLELTEVVRGETSNSLLPQVGENTPSHRLPQTDAQSASMGRSILTDHIHILDLCAGSGAIGVAVAKALPEVQVTFGEIDPAHLPTIEKNLLTNTLVNKGIGERFTIVQSDLFENIAGKFDYILSNPPYINQAAKTTDESVIHHEPHLALWGGEKGLELIHRIIIEAPTYLLPNGQLWLEHEPSQTAAITTLAKASGFTSTTYTDQYGVERYSVLMVQ